MGNSAITSVLARCLVDADFLERLREDPRATLTGLGVDADTASHIAKMDHRRIAVFSGFITKVKHNHLWEDFPYTRILLRRSGEELSVFVSFRREYQRICRDGLSRRAKIARWGNFLDGYLRDRDAPIFQATRDVLRHERFRWEVGPAVRELADAGSYRQQRERGARAPEDGVVATRRTVPCRRGIWDVGRFSHQPLELIESLRRGELDIKRLQPRQQWLLHLAEIESGQVRLVEIEPPVGVVLSLVDGRRSVAGIAQEIGTEATGPLCEFMVDARRQGLLRWNDG